MTRRLDTSKTKRRNKKSVKIPSTKLKDCRQYILVNNYGYYIYLPMVGGKRSKTTRNLRTLASAARPLTMMISIVVEEEE